jgi:hypothetical protein
LAIVPWEVSRETDRGAVKAGAWFVNPGGLPSDRWVPVRQEFAPRIGGVCVDRLQVSLKPRAARIDAKNAGGGGPRLTGTSGGPTGVAATPKVDGQARKQRCEFSWR